MDAEEAVQLMMRGHSRGPSPFADAARLASAALLASALVAVGVALLVVRGVIPPVDETWAPQTRGSGGAVPALWVSVVANLVFASAVAGAAVTRTLARRWVWWLLVLLAAGALVQALMYLDAARAFTGPLSEEMAPARDRLRLAALGDLAAGVALLLVAGFARWGRRLHPSG